MNLFQVTARELAVDCNDVPGVSGIAVLGIQEESVLDLVKASGCRVAGIYIGLGDVADQNGAALSNFNVLTPTEVDARRPSIPVLSPPYSAHPTERFR